MDNKKQMHRIKPNIFSYNSETIFIPNMTQSYLFQPAIPMSMLQWENHMKIWLSFWSFFSKDSPFEVNTAEYKADAYKDERKEAKYSKQKIDFPFGNRWSHVRKCTYEESTSRW